jgi:hypothetical protein
MRRNTGEDSEQLLCPPLNRSDWQLNYIEVGDRRITPKNELRMVG